jgi:hypothetical protein
MYPYRNVTGDQKQRKRGSKINVKAYNEHMFYVPSTQTFALSRSFSSSAERPQSTITLLKSHKSSRGFPFTTDREKPSSSNKSNEKGKMVEHL